MSRPPLVRLLFALVLAVPGWMAAADSAPAAGASEAPATPVAPVAPVVDGADDLATLKAALPTIASLVDRNDALWWDDGKGSAYRVVAATDGGARLETEIGVITVGRKLLSEERLDALAALPKLIAQAQAAKVSGEGLTLAEGIITGIHLFSADLRVLSEGVLRKAPVDVDDRSADVKRIEEAAAKAKASLAASSFEALGKRTLEDFISRLPLANNARKFEYDEVLPEFARRVVRHGWLAVALKDTPEAKAVQGAVDAAAALKPVKLFEGPKLRMAEVRNAFGEGGWVLSTPTRTSYLCPHPHPMYLWGAKEAGMTVVVDLPSGADPLVDAAKATAVRLYDRSTLIASWSPDQGFAADPAVWRTTFPDQGPQVDENVVKHFLPPHVVVVGLDGDVKRLITAHGALTPPRDGFPEEAERFLTEAAKVLPDPAHLDLVGEYLFYYVYDSPDSRHPGLIGNKQVKGDIHQTAYQTLATATGGMCRGDCDDLSELYQAITEHQGRTAHIITLPAHAALAYADKQGDDWHIYVLQTGQPREFSDPSLPEALRKAYLSFDESDNFDPNGLGLLLRFSGENTRSGWRLSWRIFAEPEYAKTMIDVQKDWHFQTYQRGIRKMLKLIADGDNDTANYRELSGLYDFTGQYDLAVEYHKKALAATTDGESRIYANSELVMHLLDAEQIDEARAVTESILEVDLPALGKEMGARQLQLGFQLAGFLVEGDVPDLAQRVISQLLLDDMSKQIEQVGDWLKSPGFDPKRWEHADQLRRLQQMYAVTSIGLIEDLPADGLPGDESLQQIVASVQRWLDRVAMHDIDEPDDVLMRYAAAARFYAAVLGQERLRTLVVAAPMPASAEYDHTARIGGVAQVARDLPWIRASVPYWAEELQKQFARKHDKVDTTLALDLVKRVAEARAACEKLGFDAGIIDHQAHLAAVIGALLAKDEAALRERLRYVREKNDKRLRDDTAQWLGDCARALPLDWYATVLDCWKDEIDYKPKYFWIAWRAALNGAPKHALLTAKLAAERFADDDDFAEEYAFMRTLLDKPEAKDRPATPAEAPAVVAPQR